MPNFLMISFDDMFSLSAWPEFAGLLQTPHLDAFAAGATNFTHAYATVALCNPSRSSILSGHNPMESGITGNSGHIFDVVPQADNILSRLHEAGYSVALGGKVFHEPPSAKMAYFVDTFLDDGGYKHGDSIPDDDPNQPFNIGPSGSTVLADSVLAQSVVDFLSQAHTQPFALAAGTYRPHAPWRVPQEFFDMYDPAQIPVPYFGTDTQGMADFYYALTGSAFHQQVITADAWVDLIHAYLAAVSYADYLFGQMIDALDASPYAADTQVVVWSDHGYHLGDRGEWGKFTLWEESGNAPLIVRTAGQTQGAVVDTVVSLQDVYPTILDLMGIDGGFRGHGNSLAPLLPGGDPASFQGDGAFTWMYGGYSYRQGDFRYIHNEDGSEELYDIAHDRHQVHNLVADPAYADVLAALEAHLPTIPGFDLHVGTAGDDSLTGSDARDIFIVGGAGADTAVGGGGDDQYQLTGTATIVEAVDGGYDAVYLGKSANRAPDNVEAIFIRQDLALRTVYGNDSDNAIYAIASKLRFYALGGSDHFYGGVAGDTVYGGDGDDLLEGDRGADRLFGEVGADTLLGQLGDDRLFGGDGWDKLVGGDGADRLDGGRGTDSLNGGNGDDVLIGGWGSDGMIGGLGNDTYYLDRLGDKVREKPGEGIDTVHVAGFAYTLTADAENLVIDSGAVAGTGNQADNVMTGSDLANALYGLGGNDTLDGGGGDDILVGETGTDRLTGGVGADRFVFVALTCSTADAAGADVIADFTQADGDRIDLSAIDADPAAIDDQAFAFMGTAAFSGMAGELRYALDGAGNTLVQLDVDGDTVCDMSIVLAGEIMLVEGDFVL